jgi:hypothetical protein
MWRWRALFVANHCGELVIECGERVIYLANPDKVAAVQAGYSFPVGFPTEDVFDFDPELYDRLRSQWDRDGRTDPQLWNEATPFRLPASRG